MKYKIGIIGKGFVGSAVSDGFSKIEQYVVDPRISADNTIDKLVNEFDPPLTFVCVPTPPNEDGSVNLLFINKSILEIINQSKNNKKITIIVRSTVPTDYIESHLSQFLKKHKIVLTEEVNIIDNPEFI